MVDDPVRWLPAGSTATSVTSRPNIFRVNFVVNYVDAPGVSDGPGPDGGTEVGTPVKAVVPANGTDFSGGGNGVSFSVVVTNTVSIVCVVTDADPVVLGTIGVVLIVFLHRRPSWVNLPAPWVVDEGDEGATEIYY